MILYYTNYIGKVLGVIGVGRIGREVAKWCRGFGMTTVGYDPVLSEQSARNFGIMHIYNIYDMMYMC